MSKVHELRRIARGHAKPTKEQISKSTAASKKIMERLKK